MKYELSIRRKAQKQLSRLDSAVRHRCYAAIEVLANEPRPRDCQKLTNIEGWRIRVGQYRVVYEIDDDAGVVHVLRVLHRREAYG